MSFLARRGEVDITPQTKSRNANPVELFRRWQQRREEDGADPLPPPPRAPTLRDDEVALAGRTIAVGGVPQWVEDSKVVEYFSGKFGRVLWSHINPVPPGSGNTHILVDHSTLLTHRQDKQGVAPATSCLRKRPALAMLSEY